MIKRKIVELTNIKFQNTCEEWVETDVFVIRADELENDEEPAIELRVGSVAVVLSVQDLLDCLEYLDIDLEAYK